MPRKQPVDDPTLRERTVDVPMSRNKLDDFRAHEPTPQDRPVDDPKLRGRSVDDMTHVPMPGEKLVNDPVYELVIIERPADVVMYEPAPRERPVEDTKFRPVDDVVYDSAPRDRPVDDQNKNSGEGRVTIKHMNRSHREGR